MLIFFKTELNMKLTSIAYMKFNLWINTSKLHWNAFNWWKYYFNNKMEVMIIKFYIWGQQKHTHKRIYLICKGKWNFPNISFNTEHSQFSCSSPLLHMKEIITLLMKLWKPFCQALSSSNITMSPSLAASHSYWKNSLKIS